MTKMIAKLQTEISSLISHDSQLKDKKKIIKAEKRKLCGGYNENGEPHSILDLVLLTN